MKQFCLRGHDTFITGRVNHGTCRICDRERHRGTAHREGWRKHQLRNIDGTWFRQIDYDRLYQIQQGCCAICKVHSTDLGRMFGADHDHLTGIVRGLLCVSCNMKLGLYEDKEFAKKADNYLKPTMPRGIR
jgi:hypothetical protein